MSAKKKPLTGKSAQRALDAVAVSSKAFGDAAPVVADILQWLYPRFVKGQRKCDQKPTEWDFRAIKDVNEAREACAYEYHREAEWAYDYASDAFKNYQHGLGEAIEAKWPYHPLLGLLPVQFFPIPWLNLPMEARISNERLAASVHEMAAVNIAAALGRSKLSPSYGVYAISIRWNNSPGVIMRDFKALINKLRPKSLPEAKTLQGKRTDKPFEQLKWLAAWRLRSSGLSFERAQTLLERTYTPGTDPHNVLPFYESSGSWQSHAINKASALIAEIVQRDPRAAP